MKEKRVSKKVSEIDIDRTGLIELTDIEMDLVAGGATTGALTITNFNGSQPRAADRLGSGAALFSQRQRASLALNALKPAETLEFYHSFLWVTVTGRAMCVCTANPLNA
jgi:hypothetical protein